MKSKIETGEICWEGETASDQLFSKLTVIGSLFAIIKRSTSTVKGG